MALIELEPFLIWKTRYLRGGISKDEVRQNMRISLWELFLRDKEDRDYDIGEILEFFMKYINKTLFFCSRKMYKENKINRDRNVSLDSLYFDDGEEAPKVNELLQTDSKEISDVDFSIDMIKYRKVLNEKEFEILLYLNYIGMDISNFESIGRQMGYSGKGGMKYIITKIAHKIRKVNAN